MSEDGRWKEYDELLEEQQYWNKKTFTIVSRNGVVREVDKLKFILGLRSTLIKKFGSEASTLTRRQIVNFLDAQYKVRNELRRYCDLSEENFESMLDGASFPYLDRAWASMFHPGILQDMAEDRRAFNDAESTVQPKRDQPAKQPKKKKPQPKTDEETQKVAEKTPPTIKESISAANNVIEEKKPRGRPHSYMEIPEIRYTLDLLLRQISEQANLTRFQAKIINNRIRVLLFCQKLQLQYSDRPLTLGEFIRLCVEDKISSVGLDSMFGTNRLFTNIFAGNNKGIHNSEQIKKLFMNAFGVQLILQ